MLTFVVHNLSQRIQRPDIIEHLISVCYERITPNEKAVPETSKGGPIYWHPIYIYAAPKPSRPEKPFSKIYLMIKNSCA